MPPRMYTIKPPTNPFLQVLYFLVGGVLLIGVVLMSAVILAFALGFAIILGLVIYVRVWWLKRKFARSGGKPDAGPFQSNETKTIEVEYTVIDERDERDN